MATTLGARLLSSCPQKRVSRATEAASEDLAPRFRGGDGEENMEIVRLFAAVV